MGILTITLINPRQKVRGKQVIYNPHKYNPYILHK